MEKPFPSIRTSGIAPLLVRTLLHPSLLRAFTPFLRIVASGFFLNQYFCRRIPTALVSHPLDDEIPYDPGVSALYLDFVRTWMRTLSWLFRVRGRRALPEVRSFLREMTLFYSEAAWIYNHHKSTTPRPPAGRNPLTRIIHRADPHLHCIPSLHVIIVLFTWIRCSSAAARLGIPREQREKEAAFLRRRALDITDAILLMKQHSLNCIGSSLFFLHHFLEDFSDEQADRIIDSFFRLLISRGAVSSDFPARAGEAIRSRYHCLRSKEENPGRGYKQIILDSLKSYPRTGSFSCQGLCCAPESLSRKGVPASS